MSYWNGKVAIVVGGSAGLGKAIAIELLQSGAKTILLARNQERLDVTTRELREIGTVTSKAVDVSKPQEVVKVIQELTNEWGSFDAVFNCVGKSTREAVMDVDSGKITEMLQANLNSIVNVALAVIPELKKSRGHLVHIGSLASKTAWPFVTSYAVSKSAMATYTHQLRLEGPREVNYLLVCPGPIARNDTGTRYEQQSSNLPEHAKAGAAGAKLKGIPPEQLAGKILRAAAKRKKELIVPAYARIAFIAAAISPTLGDWILSKKMSK